MTHPFAPTSGPSAGAFRVDLQRAPRAIADLETTLDELKELRLQALRLGQVTPAARDQVSIDAAEMLGRSAAVGQGSLLAALDSGIGQVEALIDRLRADLREYRSVEDGNATTFRERA